MLQTLLFFLESLLSILCIGNDLRDSCLYSTCFYLAIRSKSNSFMFQLQIGAESFYLLLQSCQAFVKLGGNILTIRRNDRLGRI